VIPIVEPIQKVNAFTKKGKHQSGVQRTRDREGTNCRLLGSRSLSFCNTRTSMRLASRYFCMARMILIATRLFVSMSTASTTLPNVPCPSKRTVRSSQIDELVGMDNNYGKPTALIDYVIWGDDVVTLFIIAGDLLLWCLVRDPRNQNKVHPRCRND
jgi:hypothetical protein